MEPAGNDGSVDPQPHPDAVEADRGGSFDPGLETGYLRRAPRDHELSPELGAAPFDPGPERYDERRARRQAKRRQRDDRQWRTRGDAGSRAGPAGARLADSESLPDREPSPPPQPTAPVALALGASPADPS